jgi:hypothetical protein
VIRPQLLSLCYGSIYVYLSIIFESHIKKRKKERKTDRQTHTHDTTQRILEEEQEKKEREDSENVQRIEEHPKQLFYLRETQPYKGYHRPKRKEWKTQEKCAKKAVSRLHKKVLQTRN